MILYKKTEEFFGKSYDDVPVKAKVICKCDYCGQEFNRIKNNLDRSHKITPTDSCLNPECIQKKRIESNRIIFGSDSPMQSEAIKEKGRQTNITKYGVPHACQNTDVKKERKQACLEKYGVTNVFASPEIKERIKETNLIKYGVENPFQNEDIKLKQQNTMMDIYGVDHYSKTDEHKQKVKKTSLERYGVDCNLKCEETKSKIKETNIKKYGVENPMQNEAVREKLKQTMKAVYGVENPMQLPEIFAKAKQTCLDIYGKWPVGNYGQAQSEIEKWINDFGFNFSSNTAIPGGSKELDLYDAEKKLAIEYCGLYFHNEKSPDPRGRYYHYNKYKTCLDNGIQLLTIFEDEWLNRQYQCKSHIKSILGIVEQKIFARKCIIKEIDKCEARPFIDEYHIQGSNNLSKICFGLYHAEELVGVMTLGHHHRQNGSSNLVLDRLCFKHSIQVIGGASKLFSRCIEWAKKGNYSEIISFSDNRWSLGKVYEAMNFEMDREYRPDYCYVNTNKPTTRISKQSQAKKPSKCPEGLTEHQWALQRGLARIWDCGKKRWIYNL